MRIKYNSDQKIIEATKLFIKGISEVGLTSISSHELQVRILDFILRVRSDANKSDYFELSKLLIIPESKLKKMSYEIQLRNNADKISSLTQDQIKLFEKETIESAISSFKIESSHVIIEIQDEFAKNLLKDKLRSKNHIADSSFNPELIKINIDAFIDVINLFLPRNKKSDKVRDNFKEYNKLKRRKASAKALKNVVVKAIPCGNLIDSVLTLTKSLTEQFSSEFDDKN